MYLAFYNMHGRLSNAFGYLCQVNYTYASFVYIFSEYKKSRAEIKKRTENASRLQKKAKKAGKNSELNKVSIDTLRFLVLVIRIIAQKYITVPLIDVIHIQVTLIKAKPTGVGVHRARPASKVLRSGGGGAISCASCPHRGTGAVLRLRQRPQTCIGELHWLHVQKLPFAVMNSWIKSRSLPLTFFPVQVEEVGLVSELGHLQEVMTQLEKHSADPHILPPASEQVRYHCFLKQKIFRLTTLT